MQCKCSDSETLQEINGRLINLALDQVDLDERLTRLTWRISDEAKKAEKETAEIKRLLKAVLVLLADTDRDSSLRPVSGDGEKKKSCS